MKKKKLIGLSAFTLLLAAISVVFFSTNISGYMCDCRSSEAHICSVACFPGDFCVYALAVGGSCENFNFPARCCTRWNVLCQEDHMYGPAYKRFYIETQDYCPDCYL